MKRLIPFLFPLILCAEVGGLASLPTFASRSNAALNSGFELGSTGPDSWTISPWIWTSSGCRTGSHCLSLTNQGSTNAFALAGVPNVQFRSARLRAWLKVTGTGLTDASEFSIGLACLTDNGWSNASGHVGIGLNVAARGTEWFQYTLEDNITWSSVHYGHDLQIKLQAKNIPATAIIYVDDVEMTPSIVPLTIFPLYPNYRGMLWADQGTTMKWQAIVEVPEGESIDDLRVDTELLNSGKSLTVDTISAITLNAVDTTGGLGAKRPGTSLNTQVYDASGLDDGAYYLRGKLIRKSTSTLLYTYPDYKIVKEAPSAQRDGWKAWVDKYNRAVLNGKPRFIWGSFLNPVFACNDGVGPFSNPDYYRGLIASKPVPFTWWNRGLGATGGTILKLMADAKMNTDIYFGALAGANIGVVNAAGAQGTVSSNGISVTGSGTAFLSQLAAGDTIDIDGFTGTGSVTSYGIRVIGSGTSFITQIKPFDVIVANSQSRYVARVVSDTELIVQSAFSPALSATPFTIHAYRTVQTIYGDADLDVDAEFPSNLAGSSYTRNLCSSFNSAYSQILPWIQAASDFDIWHLHIVVSYGAEAKYNPVWANVCRMDAAAAINKLLTHSHGASGILANQPGWLGVYVADEPPPNDSTKGMAVSFTKARAAMDAQDPATGKSVGGINYWVDGLQAIQAWNQWANFMDASGPDPYPYRFGALADDVAYGVGSGANEQRQGRSYWWPRTVADGQFDARPLWTTIELFCASGTTDCLPPHATGKIQVISSLAAGSTGLLWWQVTGNTSMGCRADDTYYAAWQKGAKVIADWMPVLEEPVQDVAGRMDGEPEYGRLIASVSDPDVKCSSRRKGSRVLLACVNTTAQTKTGVTVTMTSSIPGKVVRAWDGSQITPSGAIFSDTFHGLTDTTAPENSAHLYVLDLQPAALKIGAR